MDYKIVHRTFICAVLLALALMFVGCGNDSFITLTSTESPARDAKAVFELDISGISAPKLPPNSGRTGKPAPNRSYPSTTSTKTTTTA